MALSIGVVSLSHNQGTYLLEAINSVLMQRPDNYVIYDCASRDDSRKLLATIQNSNVQKILVEADSGPAEGLNVALANLEEDIFFYLNADDRLLPGAFAFAKEYFSLNPTCDILHGSVNLIDETGTIFKKLPAIRFSLWRYAIKACVVYQQATFIRKNILKENAFNTENRVSWDGELIVDLAIAGAQIHKTNYLLGEFRVHRDSISSSGNYLQNLETEHCRISRKILSSDPRIWERVAGITIAMVEAIFRRIFNRSKNLPNKYKDDDLPSCIRLL